MSDVRDDSDQIAPIDAADQVSHQARFAAREFVARFAREVGGELSAVVTDRMLFAYEMGYLRGRSDGAQAAMQTFHEMLRATAGGDQ